MDDYTQPKPKPILTRFRHAAAFLIEASAVMLAIPVALIANAGAAVGGKFTFSEVVQDVVEAFSEAKRYLKLMYMEYIA